MALRPLLSGWDAQPQEPVGINRDNPLSRGVSAFFLPSNGLESGLSGAKWATVGAVLQRSVGRFVGSENTTTAESHLQLSDARQIVGTTSASVLVFFNKTDSTPRRNVLFSSEIQSEAAGSTRFSADVPWEDGVCYFDFGGQAGNNRISVGGLTYTKPTCFMFAGATQGLRIVQDGVLRASSSVAVTRTVGAGPFGFNWQSNLFVSDLLNIYLAVVFDRDVPLEECIELTRSPWQLFAPIPVPTNIFTPPLAPTGKRYRQIVSGWDSQPQESVEIDWGHPLFRGATRATVIVGGQPFAFSRNLPPFQKVNATGTPTVSYGSNGRGWQSLSSDVIKLAPIITSIQTALILGSVYTKTDSSANYVGFRHLLPYGVSFGDGAGSGGGNRRDWDYPNTSNKAVAVRPSASGPATAPTVYVDGLAVTVTAAGSPGTGTAYNWGGATTYYLAGTFFSTASIQLAVFVDVLASDEAMALASARPWEIFVSPLTTNAPIYTPPAGVPLLSSPTLTSIAATTARPQVSVTFP